MSRGTCSITHRECVYIDGAVNCSKCPVQDMKDEIDRLREKNKKLEEQNEKLRIDDHDYWWQKQMEIDSLRKENKAWRKRWEEITRDIEACSDDEYEGQSEEWIKEIEREHPLPGEKEKEVD